MATSFGGALASGVPVVLTFGTPKPVNAPEVILQEGKEKEALETLEKLGIIKLMYATKGKVK